MKFRDTLKISVKDLKNRKGRTILTAVAIAVGTMLIVTMSGIGYTARDYILKSIKESGSGKVVSISPMKAQTSNKNGSSSLNDQINNMDDTFKKISKDTESDVKAISGVDEIRGVISAKASEIKIGDTAYSKKVTVDGYDYDYSLFPRAYVEETKEQKKRDSLKPIKYGALPSKDDKDGALIGETLLKKAGITDYNSVIGKELTLIDYDSSSVNIKLKPIEIKLKITGVVDKDFDEGLGIVVSADKAAEIKGYSNFEKDYMENKGYDYLNAYSKDFGGAKDIGKSVKKMGYVYSSNDQVAEEIKSIFTVGNEIAIALGVIILFVAGLGVVNTITMTIYERTKYIGIMKSLGARRSNIGTIFICESASIGFLGGIIGIVLSFINVKLIQLIINVYLSGKGVTEKITMSMPLWLVIGSLAFSIGISALAGIYPSYRAAKLDPVEALSY